MLSIPVILLFAFSNSKKNNPMIFLQRIEIPGNKMKEKEEKRETEIVTETVTDKNP